MPRQYYNASEAARTLGISLDTLRRWDRQGRIKTKRDAEALPYYERLMEEFQQSEYLEQARKRIVELKGPKTSKSEGG